MKTIFQDTYNRKIFKGNNFSSEMEKFRTSKEGEEIITGFNEKHLPLSDNFTYRLINHWESIGLIDNTRKKEGNWRKFSPKDVIWMLLIIALRDFGFSNGKIANVKKSLIDLKDKNNINYPLLEYFIVVAFSEHPVWIIVNKDGFADIGSSTDIGITEGIGQLNENHIRISLNSLLQELSSEDIMPKINFTIPLNKNECEIITAIRSGNYKSIKVRFNNGTINVLEKTEEISAEQKIIEILKENKFQDIEIKQKNGTIVSLKRTTRTKL